MAASAGSRASRWWALIAGFIGIAILLSLGTWQVQRLAWKEALIARIDARIHAPPRPLAEVEAAYAAQGDVDYERVTVTGQFLHGGERHFFTTWQGASGFNVYTPLELADRSVVLVNRGFVPYDLKEPAKRPAGQVEGEVTIDGLARNPVAAKPSSMLPDNDPAANIFYWKDRDAMAASGGVASDRTLLPFFIDAGNAPNPGGLPVGGVTIVDMPNSHLQYAVTWYGLALALAGVLVVWFGKAGRSARR